MAGSYELRDAIAKAAGIDVHRMEAQLQGHAHGDPEHRHDPEKLLEPAVHNPGHGNPVATSPDGKYSIEFVECLASCGSAPVAMVDDLFKENIKISDAAKLLKLKQSDAVIPRVRPPHQKEKRIVFKNIDRDGWTNDIECYLNDGGYAELRKAMAKSPEEIVDEVKASGLRGRGGAGFPCGVKWGFIKPGGTKPVYLICNADESEPGTFKDRYIIHQDPHQLIEGMIISCYAVGAKLAYIYIRGEFPEGALILETAVAEARKRGFLGKNILGSGFDCEILRASRSGRLHLRRGNGLDRVARRQTRLSAHQAALFSRCPWTLPVSDDRQQRRDPVRREAHRRNGRRGICQIRQAEQYRHPDTLRERGR